MADEIEIKNVGDGGVASEATLKALLAAVNKMGGASGSSKASKVQDMHNRAVESGIKVSTKNRDALKKNTKSVKRSTKAVSDFANKLTGAFFGGIGTALAGLKNFTGELIDGGTEIGDFSKHIPILGTLFGPFVGYLDKSIESFRTLSSVGASFGNDIESMRRAAATSGMSMDEFTGFIGENAETIRLFGNSVTTGANGFLALNKELKKTGKFTELKELGFSVMDINEGLVGYAALQSRLGRLQGQSTEQLANGAGNYLKELDKLAKVTGKSRKELEDSMAAQAADAGFRALANQLEAGSQEFMNFNASMALIDDIGGSTAIALKDLADGVPQTEEAIALVNAAGPGIIDVMRRVSEGADPQILIDALGEAGGEIEGFASASGEQRAAMIQALRESNPALASILDEATKLTQLGSQSYNSAREEQAKRDEITSKLTTFDDSIRSIRETIQVALIDSGIFNTLGTMVADGAAVLKDTLASPEFKSSIESLSAQIKSFLTDIQNVGISEAIKNLFDGVNFGQMIKEFLFGSKPSESEGGSNVPAGADAAAEAGGSSGLLSGIFGDLSALEVGAGVVGGLLGAGGVVYLAVKGFQALLAGFGTGPVAAGALVLTGMLIGTGAAIKLAGEGISSAGDGIKKVADGVERLAGMKDTANFENIADSLGKIGPALISLTAGGVLDSITSFFGADSPFEKLRDGINEFGGIKPEAIANLKTAGEGLTTFTNISDTLDDGPVKRYAEAIEELAGAMKELNEALADKNSGFGESDVSVASLLSKGQTLGGGSGMSEEQINQLNTTMSLALGKLTEIKQVNDKQLSALNNLGDVY